jgi:hypothetical protein
MRMSLLCARQDGSRRKRGEAEKQDSSVKRAHCGLDPDLPAFGGWAQFERRTCWGRGPHGTSLCGSGRTRRAR